MSVTSISSQYRAPHADPTDRNRTARRPRFYATYGHTLRLIRTFERRQDQARPSSAQDNRRDHHVQAIETSSGEKAREGVCAAFDQNATHTIARECGKDCRGGDLPVGCRQRDNFHTGGRRTARSLRRDQQTPDTVVGENPRVGAKPTLRIDNNT